MPKVSYKKRHKRHGRSNTTGNTHLHRYYKWCNLEHLVAKRMHKLICQVVYSSTPQVRHCWGDKECQTDSVFLHVHSGALHGCNSGIAWQYFHSFYLNSDFYTSPLTFQSTELLYTLHRGKISPVLNLPFILDVKNLSYQCPSVQNFTCWYSLYLSNNCPGIEFHPAGGYGWKSIEREFHPILRALFIKIFPAKFWRVCM